MNKRTVTGLPVIQNTDAFKDAVYAIADTYETCFVYDSCRAGVACDHKKYELMAALGVAKQLSVDVKNLDDLYEFHQQHKDWIFGGFSYDLKNELEDLVSENPDAIEFPVLRFFVPEHVILLSADGKTAELQSTGDVQAIQEQLAGQAGSAYHEEYKQPEFKSSLNRNEYLSHVENIREHIRAGDVYELNYCMQYVAESDYPPGTMPLYRQLTGISPVPFAAFARFDDFEILSASPERYLCKRGNTVISQPIKGTAGRSANPASDLQNRQRLQNSLKDRAENVMIVDLVRNDLARTCIPGSVQVQELFGIYEFPQVFQMISTIRGTVQPGAKWTDLIRHSFPMGSMTGAPKIAAMKLIDKFEDFSRGWYSGSLGYVSPSGDFDFNVLIRSIFINRAKRRMMYAVGGAITIDSDPGDEYQECMWKASAIRSLFSDTSPSGE